MILLPWAQATHKRLLAAGIIAAEAGPHWGSSALLAATYHENKSHKNADDLGFTLW